MSIGPDATESFRHPEFEAALRQLHRVVEQLVLIESGCGEALNTAAPDLHAALRDSRRILEHLVMVYAQARGVLFTYQPLPDESDGEAPAPPDDATTALGQ